MSRLGERNKQDIYYALYDEKTPILDEDGYRTGEYTKGYQDPVLLRANVSASRGVASQEMFGTDIEYSNVMVIGDTECPIDENTILWIGIGTDKPHNYIVKKVAKSLTNISYAIKKVDLT